MRIKRWLNLALVMTLAAGLATGCKKKDDNDDDEDGGEVDAGGGNGGNGGGGAGPGSGAGTLVLAVSTSSSSGSDLHLKAKLTETLVADSLSFTPTSFRLPVMKITIANDDGSEEQNIYTCAGATEAECLVDLADQASLDALATAAGKAVIRVGDYERLSLYTCADGSSGTTATIAYVTGSATFLGENWRTDSTAVSGIDHSGTGDPSEAQVGNWSCSTKNVVMKPAVSIAEATEVQLTVVVDNTFGALFGSLISPGKGGCKTDSENSGDGICVTYPALMPYVGADTGSMKRFLITHHEADDVADAIFDDDMANALVLVGVNAEGVGFMASGREFYSATSAQATNNSGDPEDLTYGGPTYITETNYATFAANADGSIAFEQGGSGDANAAVFTAFNIESHEGAVETKDGATTWSYRAIELE